MEMYKIEKERLVESIRDSLREKEVELRTFCHHKLCKEVYHCPGYHISRCKGRLNLATSIAWEAAEITKRHVNDRTLKKVCDATEEMGLLLNIVDRHYTANGRLADLIEETLSAFVDLRRKSSS